MPWLVVVNILLRRTVFFRVITIHSHSSAAISLASSYFMILLVRYFCLPSCRGEWVGAPLASTGSLPDGLTSDELCRRWSDTSNCSIDWSFWSKVNRNSVSELLALNKVHPSIVIAVLKLLSHF